MIAGPTWGNSDTSQTVQVSSAGNCTGGMAVIRPGDYDTSVGAWENAWAWVSTEGDEPALHLRGVGAVIGATIETWAWLVRTARWRSLRRGEPPVTDWVGHGLPMPRAPPADCGGQEPRCSSPAPLHL